MRKRKFLNFKIVCVARFVCVCVGVCIGVVFHCFGYLCVREKLTERERERKRVSLRKIVPLTVAETQIEAESKTGRNLGKVEKLPKICYKLPF